MIRCPECNTALDLRRVPNSGKDEPTPIAEVIALHKFGATNTEIASLYGITNQRVSAIIRRHT